MQIQRDLLFTCDVCRVKSAWIRGQWIAHIYMLKNNWEHEFHVCSKKCDDLLSGMTKKERIKLAEFNQQINK